jgi:hypothetical protein
VAQLRRLIAASGDELARGDGRAVTLAGARHGFAVIAARVSQAGGAAGTLCVGHDGLRGGFRARERELLAVYARLTGLGLDAAAPRDRHDASGLNRAVRAALEGAFTA